ncbi:MAG: hypothetical protein RSB50_05320 [Cetobacterium sp.]
MRIIKDDFLKKYRIDEEKFENTGLVWEELIKIYLDFEAKEKDYKKEAKEILDKLNDFNGVSAVRYRVKDKEHLIEKIIRKRISNKNRIITLENYEKEITDLVGFRVTHIFKDDWKTINRQIIKKWQTKEITAFYREGDEEYYSGIGLDLGKMTKKEHPRGYRSVHYILELKNGSYQKNIEIQVRTIFEEAWSEMDHKVIYPYHINNEVLNNYSKILNRVAGMADEMGNFMKKEVNSLSKLDKLDDENKSLKTENEILKAKIREYENHKIDEEKNINKRLKDKYIKLFNPLESGGLAQLIEAQNRYKKMFDVSEESAVAQVRKAQEKYKKLFDPLESSGLAQLIEAQNKYKKMFDVSEESAVAQVRKAQEKYKKLFDPLESSGLAQLIEAQNKYKKMFDVSEESAVAQVRKAQEKYKKLFDPLESSGLAQLIEAQNKYKKMFDVSEESAVAQVRKAQEKYNEAYRPLKNPIVAQFIEKNKKIKK